MALVPERDVHAVVHIVVKASVIQLVFICRLVVQALQKVFSRYYDHGLGNDVFFHVAFLLRLFDYHFLSVHDIDALGQLFAVHAHTIEGVDIFCALGAIVRDGCDAVEVVEDKR